MSRVTVTGTRITRPGMETPVPVTSVTREEMLQLSPSTLLDAVDQLPQFVNNSTPENVIGWSGSAGQSFLNLRGIGSNRTLVLLDGRRIVASTRRGATDIGVLPEVLVDRVEIVTGGASAAYGSDAVAGVVNFILDKDFEGVAGHVQAGVSERGDYASYEFSLAAGMQLDQSTRLLVAVDGYANEGVPDYLDREWHESWSATWNPDPNGPDLAMLPNVVSSVYTYGGLIPRGPLAGTQFLPNGQAAPFNYGIGSTGGVQIGGDGVDVGRERTLSPPAKRTSAFLYLSQDWTPNLTGYFQLLHGRNIVEFDKDPNFMSGSWEATIFSDNAYLSEDVRGRMVAAGVTSFPFARYASRGDLSAGQVRTDNSTISVTAGVEGEIGGWRTNAYYQYGVNQQDLEFKNVVRVDRVYRAMDAVRDPASGAIVCRSTLSFPDDGCVPTSFFGDGAVSQAAKAWIFTDNTLVQNLAQHFFEVAIDGEPFSTPAGPVLLALGASRRSETYEQYSTPYQSSQRTPTASSQGYRGLPSIYASGYSLVERASIGSSHGAARVWEAFTETIVPLVSDQPFARSVDLQAALRFATYEGSGDIWAWKAGLDWEMTDEIRLRSTLSRDVRGGTLAERFDRAPGGTTARDPFLEGSPVYSFGEVQAGNPSIDPERADTWTIGAVLQPDFLPGFSISADYYDVRIHDAISRPGVQTIINGCYDGVAEMCDLITRNDAGFISLVNSTFLNVDLARTSGIDIEAAYATPISVLGGAERLDLRGMAAIYTEASLTPFGRPRDEFAGETGPGGGLPDYRLLASATYTRDALAVGFTAQYIAEGAYNLDFEEGVHITDNTVDAMWYANARISYLFDVRGGQVEAFFNVRNLFDRDPPIAGFSGGGFYGTMHAPSDFDQIGRRYTAGVSWRF